VTNGEIADSLTSLAQLLSAQKENPFKVKAYRRAAKVIRNLSASLSELVDDDADLTAIPGIGKGIAGAIREIAQSGCLRQLDSLRAQVAPELAAMSEYPKLDPTRVLRVYKKLKISSVEELRHALDTGEIEEKVGLRIAQHIGAALNEAAQFLLYDADKVIPELEAFLLTHCPVKRVELTGPARDRVEVVDSIDFLIETSDLPAVLEKLQRFGGGAQPIADGVQLSSGIPVHLTAVKPDKWNALPKDNPKLITVARIKGDLHAHSTSSDGRHSIEQMARAAQALGYEYVGITDHSQSLKIAGGLSPDDIGKQLRFIDKLNAKLSGFQILKSSEVDILADGSLDYPDDLLGALDYTVCSIHSRFAMNREQQTERIMRAMDNPNFNILGHATGRLLLKRPGYEIDVGRVIEHARQTGCYFEINSSPDRLDLSAENAALARKAKVKIAVNTDSHSTGEYPLIRYGIDQARRAGLTPSDVLNTRPWSELQKLLHR
jgi:DNA polymerase (family X)